MDGLNKKTYGIILAGGEGTRINQSKVNKTVFFFNGKPLIQYSVDLFENVVDKTIVVVGSHAASVKKAITTKGVKYCYQRNRLGTGHAVKVALKKIANTPEYILVGYGDHMMFYTKKIVKKLVLLHKKEKAVMSLISVEYEHPNKLAWGRIIRDNDGYVKSSVEQKDATAEEKKLKELNAGFYCFDYSFLQQNINKLRKSPVTGEYYINALVKIACRQKQKICALKVPFKYVGIGINTRQQLYESQKLYAEVKSLAFNSRTGLSRSSIMERP